MRSSVSYYVCGQPFRLTTFLARRVRGEIPGCREITITMYSTLSGNSRIPGARCKLWECQPITACKNAGCRVEDLRLVLNFFFEWQFLNTLIHGKRWCSLDFAIEWMKLIIHSFLYPLFIHSISCPTLRSIAISDSPACSMPRRDQAMSEILSSHLARNELKEAKKINKEELFVNGVDNECAYLLHKQWSGTD